MVDFLWLHGLVDFKRQLAEFSARYFQMNAVQIFRRGEHEPFLAAALGQQLRPPRKEWELRRQCDILTRMIRQTLPGDATRVPGLKVYDCAIISRHAGIQTQASPHPSSLRGQSEVVARAKAWEAGSRLPSFPARFCYNSKAIGGKLGRARHRTPHASRREGAAPSWSAPDNQHLPPSR